MRHTRLTTAAILTMIAAHRPAAAQTLHVNPRWKECSFQIDPSLTQAAWHRFTREAGLVVLFRPLDDARPLGRARFELSAVQWKSNIDASASAWNDTFVHPDSTHWLTEGNGLAIPGLTLRAGVDSKTDVAVYATKNAEANYGFYGGQVRRTLAGDGTSAWNASAGLSFVKLYGPEDLDFAVYGTDFVVSRAITLSRWASVSPYGSVTWYLSRAHEKTSAVNLSDEHVFGAQAAAGAELRLFKVRLGAEYNAARVHGLSLRVGLGT